MQWVGRLCTLRKLTNTCIRMRSNAAKHFERVTLARLRFGWISADRHSGVNIEQPEFELEIYSVNLRIKTHVRNAIEL